MASQDPERWPIFHGGQETAEDDPLTEDEVALMHELGADGTSRREFLAILSISGITLAGAQVLLGTQALAQDAVQAPPPPATPPADANAVRVSLKVNGKVEQLDLDSRASLLDTLRETLGMTGTKKGCDHGQCGACTVHVNGQRVLSCLTLAAQVDGKDITTIEGLADGETLHPMQAAFIKHDGFQCGYCTPGQICSAVALLEEIKRGDASHATADVTQPVKELTGDEIRERMSGNICRCGAYPKIVAAIQEVHTGKAQAQTWRFVGKEELAALDLKKEDRDGTV